ncbi:aminopeptidase P family protein [Roseisalinus antarcticus]|uniref:Putative peptidase n=1 Tax=Roseisalinus antarcticus TaxID=254357 RepID=A0A1Y5SG57_9RHOB|nr:aminopeptidase P family protein [Roseisalinus antarcticus]SLN40077.1 putative peptidase [Roseisalinus antarcticus]
MFQTFEVTSAPDQGVPRLAALRSEMADAGVDAFIVPRADAHQGEYVPASDERLSWLTGFTGSAGFCAVLAEEAGLFVDGRYRVQVRQQAAPVFTPVDWPETQLADWLLARLGRAEKVMFDPWLHTVAEIEGLQERLSVAGITLSAGPNLVDRIWNDRPAPPNAPFFAYPDDLAGATSAEKRQRLAAGMGKAGQDSVVLTLPDSIAWLLNIRGADVECNPVPLAFAILHADARVDLFCAPGQADPVADHLGPDVTIRDRSSLLSSLESLSGTVLIAPKSTPQIVADTLAAKGIDPVHGDDPCLLPKARKTAAELDGSRAAHLRDGAAMTRFLAWLDAEAPGGGLTEIDVVTALEGFRRGTNVLRDISFETISGAGPHGAIIHYRVTTDTNRAVKPGELLLVDSGGQYMDGTTDITRTVIVGPATEEHRRCYTAVLQGMIAVSRARFPVGITGRDLDALARFPLWTRGLDYDHGTGHGVGVYLSVHEGPQGISRRSTVPLEAGMILSNEPGYYREGAFGIRIENLVVVRPAPELPGADDRKMLDFETLTCVPLDRRLIDTRMLSDDERGWIDGYHADTLRKIGPLVDGPVLDWLETACAPL